MGKGMKPAKFQDHLKISEKLSKVKKTKKFTQHKEVKKSDTKTTYVY